MKTKKEMVLNLLNKDNKLDPKSNIWRVYVNKGKKGVGVKLMFGEIRFNTWCAKDLVYRSRYTVEEIKQLVLEHLTRLKIVDYVKIAIANDPEPVFVFLTIYINKTLEEITEQDFNELEETVNEKKIHIVEIKIQK